MGMRCVSNYLFSSIIKMNSRNNRNNTDNSRGNNQRVLIAHLRNFFSSTNTEEQQERLPAITRQNVSGSTSSREEEPTLTRDTLQLVWSRMQNLNSRERNLILTNINVPRRGQENEDEEEEEEEGSRRRYRYYDELAESHDELLNSQEDEDYIDFRTYPLIIDWGEVENEKSNAYQICEKFGYFGVSTFTTLSKVSCLRLSCSKFIQSFVDFYSKQYFKSETNTRAMQILSDFILKMPNLESLRQVIFQRLISSKELVCIKVVLDIYEHYYSHFDGPLYQSMINEYIPTSILFYSTLSDEDVEFINDKLVSEMKSTYEILKNELQCKVEKRRSAYVCHIKKLRDNYCLLINGLSERKFIL